MSPAKWCPKMLHEYLCAQQTYAPDDFTRAEISRLIAVLDLHRPVGTNGKHGQRHTPTCGCDGDGDGNGDSGGVATAEAKTSSAKTVNPAPRPAGTKLSVNMNSTTTSKLRWRMHTEDATASETVAYMVELWDFLLREQEAGRRLYTRDKRGHEEIEFSVGNNGRNLGRRFWRW